MRPNTVQGQLAGKIQEKRVRIIPVYSQSELDIFLLKKEIERLKQEIAETKEKLDY